MRVVPSRRPTRFWLPVAPTRTARSKPSSTMSTTRSESSTSKRTCAWRAENAAIAGARWRAANVAEHVSRSVPRGTIDAAATATSASSRSARSCTQRSKNAWPVSVSDSRRVVRLRSRASRCASRSATRRDTDDTDTPSRSAARAKLPVSTTRAKAVRAWKRSIEWTLLLHITQQSINRMPVYLCLNKAHASFRRASRGARPPEQEPS